MALIGPSRRAAYALAVAASLLLAVAVAVAETPEEIFARGNEAYADGRYADAVAAYESLLLYRVEDPRVEYNLAGALFRLDRLGEAILHYERARRLAPNDEEIRDNLEYARTFCVDRIEQDPLPRPVAWIVATQDALGPRAHGWVFLALWWLLVAAVTLAFSRRAGWTAARGWGVATLLVLLGAVGGSWYATHERWVGREVAVVQPAAVEVLAGPGRNNATLFTVHEGLTVELRDRRDEWVQVSLPNGLSGWLPREAIEEVR